jgi:predicted regulator of Ras-like GTPase activity (Roadblock/LC7/MglB family)
MISQTLDIEAHTVTLSRAIESIQKEANHLFLFQDVKATILFRLDGRVLTSFYEKETSNSILSVIKWVKKIISKTKDELKHGASSIKYNKRSVQKESLPVYFYRTGNSGILVVVLHSKANTGLMEIEMSRTARRLGIIIDKKRPIGDF